MHCAKVRASPFETYEEHRAACKSPASCRQCGVWFCWTGARFGQSGQLLPPLEQRAFKRRFLFPDPCGKQLPWLCTRPAAWGGPWAWGCLPCNRAGDLSTKFGRIECVDAVTSSACKTHASTKVHQRSVAALQAPSGQPDGAPAILEVSATPVSEHVPRLDRWVKAASLVETFGSFRDFQRDVEAAGVGNVYEHQD